MTLNVTFVETKIESLLCLKRRLYFGHTMYLYVRSVCLGQCLVLQKESNMKVFDEAGRYVGEFTAPSDTQEPEVFLTREKLGKIFTTASSKALKDFYYIFLENANDFAITTEFHENAFLAQVLAEVGSDLVSVRENLNYTPGSLRATFSRYRNNPNWSERDGRTSAHSANQVNIGNVAYADRLGNGNIASGDGYTYRGGGYFQLTGRGNYKRMGEVIQQTTGDAVDERNVESEIETVVMGLLSAMAFWLDNECYECTNIDCVTSKINLYTDSYEKRKEYYYTIASL